MGSRGRQDWSGHVVKPRLIKSRVLCACVVLGLGAAVAARADVGSLAEGSLVAWGTNADGECNVPSGYFVQMSAGMLHGLAVRLDGNVVAWGSNADGQRNAPSGAFIQVSAACGGSYSLGLRSNGSAAAWGYNGDGECNVPVGTFSQLSAGGSHGLGLRTNGSLAAWGGNTYGECNVPAGTKYTRVSAGYFHDVALRSDGSVAAWGSNVYGECNVPAGNYTQVSAGLFTSLALRSNGTLAAWGGNAEGECNVPAGGGFTQVAAGDLHGLALRSDGNVVAWGYNGYGECNVPTGFYLAVAAGSGYSLGLKARTSYQDLLVSGSGTGSLVQRSISVSGNMTVQSTLSMANDPTITVGGELAIQAGGSVNMTGGGWNTNVVHVGDNLGGTFTQFGGDHHVQQSLWVAPDSNSTGAYTLAGGYLFAVEIVVGGTSTAKGGTGTFTVAGGYAGVTGELVIWDGSAAHLGDGTLANLDSNHPYVDVENSGTLYIEDGVYCLGRVTGIGNTWTGTIVVESGATLWVESIKQDSLIVEAGGTVHLAAENYDLFLGLARENQSLAPEPGSLSLIGIGVLLFAKRRRSPARGGQDCPCRVADASNFRAQAR